MLLPNGQNKLLWDTLMKRKAFTLIELLVVIAVIAVLMGILMPALRMAREQARSIACSSNLKTLVLGWKLYADENDSKLVSAHTLGTLSPSNPSWVLMPPNAATDASIEDRIAYIKQGALWPFIKNEKVYRCPSDRRKNDPAHLSAYRSYGITGGLNGISDGQADIAKACRTLNDIKQPGRKYVFLPECDPRGYNRGSWILGVVRGQWIDPFGIWHRGRSTNFGFVDGHVGRRSWQSQDLVDWCYLSLDEPHKFSFWRDVQQTEDEKGDWQWAVDGYAYRSLTGPVYRW